MCIYTIRKRREGRGLTNLGQVHVERAEDPAGLRRDGSMCVYGFLWTQVAGGYRREGGSHFVSDSEVEKRLNSLRSTY
ncbi:hypothetical protein F4809DRAFT_604549 [Biscogniauxia mediterranea]|nr:hypothetical protein F4809DRAFT_604549 [Biscogniauxia mediterranea]